MQVSNDILEILKSVILISHIFKNNDSLHHTYYQYYQEL